MIDELGTLFFITFLLHFTYGTYILSTAILCFMLVLYAVLVGLDIVHRDDHQKRLIGMFVVTGLLLTEGVIAIFNSNYYA